MSKVAQSVLTDFGQAVKRARTLKGWQLSQLSNAMGGNSGISFLSDIEKGKRSISAPTVGKLIKALSLDETWIDKFLNSDTTPEAEQTQEDRIADETLAHLPQIGADEKLAQAGVTETTVISLAQRIAQETNDVAQAWAELQNAVEIALRLQSEGSKGSNHGDFVDTVLARVADLAKTGDYDTASATIDDAVDQADAQLTRLLKRGVEVALLNRDTAKAAALLIRQADLDAGGMATFETLRALRRHYYETGRDKGSNLDSALAIDLAQQVLNRATTADERGTAQNDLGLALQALGEREGGTKRLELAVTAYEELLKEYTQARVPLDWAMTQNNLGTALKALGTRESDTERLELAVNAFREALKEYTQARVPLQWAMTQNNLGTALQALGEREGGTQRLELAVAAYKEALTEYTQAHVPPQWATTQNNLGAALRVLGERESGTQRLELAVTAYKDALKERTQTRVPLQWAKTQYNLALVEIAFFDKTENPKHLARATQYVTAAREVFAAAQASHYLEMADIIIAAIPARKS